MSRPADAYDCIVVGAGAAGLMCAMTAAQRGRKVLLIEHTDKPGAKILISGGGRCNFTNLDVRPDRFVSANPHFCRSALSRYTQHDFIALVAKNQIATHEKTLGQLFCNGSARAIVDLVVGTGTQAGVALHTGVSISNISKPGDFLVETSAGPLTARSLVLATGGLSIPKMGATGWSYDIARRFGLQIVETRPGLVPFKAADAAGHAALAGVSLEAIATFEKTQFRENILFTHRGLSGPAVLQISSYWRAGETIHFDLLPDRDAGALLLERKRARPKVAPQTLLAELLPARLAQSLAAEHLPATEVANIPDRVLAGFAGRLKAWPFTPSGTEGYAKAEVTVGGIDTRDLSSKTMQAAAVPGLYAIGEAVDVTGWLGGYNFQWAWSSGWCAGQDV